MKDERAEAGTKKKAPRRAAKKAPTAAPRRAKANASTSNHKKRPVRETSVATSVAERRAPQRTRRPAITEEQRQALVAERAYFKAERRGFRGGDPLQDWVEAESEVDALILRGDEES